MPTIQPTATLTVTADTTPEQLNTFLDKAQGPDGNGRKADNVYGTRVDGKTILYLSDKARNSGDLAHEGHFATSFGHRRREARNVISTILQNTANKTYDKPAPAQDRAAKAEYIKDVSALMKNAIAHDVERGFGSVDDHKLPTSLKAADAKHATDVVRFGADQATWVNDNLAKHHVAPDLAGIGATEGHLVPSDATSPTPNDFKTRTLKLTETVELKMGTFVEKQTIEIHKSFPYVNVDGKEFKPVEVLGKGSFGLAIRYEAETDTGTEMRVIKFQEKVLDNLNDGTGETLTEHNKDATLELRNGVKFADGKEHVKGFTGYIKMPNDTLALIGDVAVNGDVADFANLLEGYCRDTQTALTPHVRRLVALTMTQDLAKGAAEIHQAGGIHGDMKPGNQVIDADGKTHIIDLGFTEAETKVSPIRNQKHAWGSVDYHAPEATSAALREYQNREEIDTDAEDIGGREEERFATLYLEGSKVGTTANPGPLSQQHQNALISLGALANTGEGEGIFAKHEALFKRAALAEVGDQFEVDSKADVFGIGVSAFALTQTMFPSDARANAAPAKSGEALLFEKAQLGMDAASHGVNTNAGTAFANHALVNATGDTVMDDLFDDVLAPHPNNRLRAAEVVTHPSMAYGQNQNGDAVGSPEVRALIVAIASKDVGRIIAARDALLLKFPDPTPAVIAPGAAAPVAPAGVAAPLSGLSAPIGNLQAGGHPIFGSRPSNNLAINSGDFNPDAFKE